MRSNRASKLKAFNVRGLELRAFTTHIEFATCHNRKKTRLTRKLVFRFALISQNIVHLPNNPFNTLVKSSFSTPTFHNINTSGKHLLNHSKLSTQKMAKIAKINLRFFSRICHKIDFHVCVHYTHEKKLFY